MNDVSARGETPGEYDTLGNIIAYENGELDSPEVIALFQHLIDTGLAWSLQGHYGRTAHAMLQAGLIERKGA